MEAEIKWEDSTTYSRNDKEKKQTAWRLNLPSFSISILNGHRDYPNEFVMHCFRLGIDTHVMKLPADTDIELVKAKAIRICKRKINDLVADLQKISN